MQGFIITAIGALWAGAAVYFCPSSNQLLFTQALAGLHLLIGIVVMAVGISKL